MRLLLNAAPSVEPVTTAEAKTHLRVEDTDSDTLIGALITAAREQAEHETGRALMAQTWDMLLDDFPSDSAIALVKPPVSAITHIKYYDAAGVLQTFAATDYSLDASGLLQRALLGYDKSWPSVRAQQNAVQIRIVCGYANAATVPGAIKQWMLLNIGHWFENRESVNIGNITSRLPFVDGLLDPYRVYQL